MFSSAGLQLGRIGFGGRDIARLNVSKSITAALNINYLVCAASRTVTLILMLHWFIIDSRYWNINIYTGYPISIKPNNSKYLYQTFANTFMVLTMFTNLLVFKRCLNKPGIFHEREKINSIFMGLSNMQMKL